MRAANKISRILVFAVFVFGIVGCSEDHNSSSSNKIDTEITFANLVPFWWNAQPVLMDFKDIPGVNIKTVEVQTGKESKNIVLNGGADIGIVAASPLVWSALQEESGFKILARYMDGPELVGIFSTSEENKGLNQPISIVEGTVSEFVMHKHASRNGVTITDDFVTLNSRPPSIIHSLKTGDAKSAVIWEPFAQQIANDKDLVLKYSEYPKNLYRMKFFLIANTKSLNTKKDAIQKIVNEFGQLSDRLVNDDGSYRDKIEKYFSYTPGYLSGRWEKVNFEFIVDKEVISQDLSDEADIILNSGLIEKHPNFDSFF